MKHFSFFRFLIFSICIVTKYYTVPCPSATLGKGSLLWSYSVIANRGHFSLGIPCSLRGSNVQQLLLFWFLFFILFVITWISVLFNAVLLCCFYICPLPFLFVFCFIVISPKPIDQEPDSTSFVGVLITILTTIILLLVVIILAIIARNKRGRGSNVLDAFQHNFNPDTLGGVDNKRLNGSDMKVRHLRLICKQQHLHKTFAGSHNGARFGINGQKQLVSWAVQRKHVYKCCQCLFNKWSAATTYDTGLHR